MGVLFLTPELMQKCTEIDEHLNLILADTESKLRPEITINGIILNFDEFEILLVTETSAYLKLMHQGERVAFVDLDDIKEFTE